MGLLTLLLGIYISLTSFYLCLGKEINIIMSIKKLRRRECKLIFGGGEFSLNYNRLSLPDDGLPDKITISGENKVDFLDNNNKSLPVLESYHNDSVHENDWKVSLSYSYSSNDKSTFKGDFNIYL